MARKTKKHQSPSRIKYEKNHPTISARLPIDKQEKLHALLQSLGTTLPQLLLHFIGEYEIKIMPLEEARKRGFYEGVGKGFQRARGMFAVFYPCSVCGKQRIVSSEEEKKAIREFIHESGWCHADCASR